MLAVDYVNAQEGSNQTNAILSIVDELKDTHPNLRSKIDNVAIPATVYRQKQVQKVKTAWTRYKNTTLTKKQAMLRMRKAIEEDPAKYSSIDGMAHFFCEEGLATYAYNATDGEYSDLVQYCDPIKLDMFKNHIAESAHTGALDILQTTENFLTQGEKIGLSLEQLGTMLQLLIKEKIPTEYESVSKLQKPVRIFETVIDMVDHYRRPSNILQLIRAVKRDVGEPIAKPLNKTKALLIEYYSVERANQTYEQNENDAEKETKRNIKHFVEKGTWNQIKKFTDLQYKSNKRVTLNSLIQFVEQVELHDSGQYALVSSKTANQYEHVTLQTNTVTASKQRHRYDTRSQGPPPYSGKTLPGRKTRRDRGHTRRQAERYSSSSGSRSPSPTYVTRPSRRRQDSDSLPELTASSRSSSASSVQSDTGDRNKGQPVNRSRNNRRQTPRPTRRRDQKTKATDAADQGKSEKTSDKGVSKRRNPGSPATSSGSARSQSPDSAESCQRCFSVNHRTKDCQRYKSTAPQMCFRCHNGFHFRDECRTKQEVRPREKSMVNKKVSDFRKGRQF